MNVYSDSMMYILLIRFLSFFFPGDGKEAQFTLAGIQKYEVLLGHEMGGLAGTEHSGVTRMAGG